MMPKGHLVFLHGLHSSPNSEKAQNLVRFIKNFELPYELHLPQLDYDADVNRKNLYELMTFLTKKNTTRVGLVGSSMGGFYAARLADVFSCKTVLINPVVDPLKLLPQVYGHHCHPVTGRQYVFDEKDSEKLLRWGRVHSLNRQAVLLCLGLQDQTLPPQEALTTYGECEKIIDPEASHSFESFEFHLPKMTSFLFG